ncbi:GSCFA domain-containing protein [Nafulsella turpanensis]|uniref:GSCFA domain-containing protein n=1 Tax=Nafulsella turpanensis TaxID=1265690 RepID=UPI00034C37D6|nr:GSCFA domain-containing protein [Nafulsella turpanensis]
MFRTELQPASPDFRIEVAAPLLTIGSCFSDLIGQRLQEYKFPAMVNPFGTIFHPAIACQLMQMALEGQCPSPDTFVQLEGRWVSHLLHSRLHAQSPEVLGEKLQTLFPAVKEQLKKAEVVMLTSGTAFLYIEEANGQAVANCHKQPQKLFRKQLGSVEEITTSFNALFQLLKEANPSVKIILTVSPVRHLKDTLELNAVSKSILRLAAHQLQEMHQDVYYFPSYELLLDDLRDYRFYGRDLLHPGEEAEEYIWQKFTATYFSENALRFIKEWAQIRRALSHRPFNPSSAAHQQFLQKTIEKLSRLPYQIDVSQEISQLKSQLL